jgi:hypothetical protein
MIFLIKSFISLSIDRRSDELQHQALMPRAAAIDLAV